MADEFTDSTARLEQLLDLLARQEDSAKRDQLFDEIRCVLDERQLLRTALRTQQPKQG
jgi:hypothetical protein